MRFNVFPVMTAVLAVGCASAASTPSFEFQPATGPLRYAMHAENGQVVETPMGTQEGTATSDITFVIDIGGPTTGGLAVSMVLESMEGNSTDRGSFSGGDLIGKSYRGTLRPDGTVELTEGPETPANLRDLFDPKEIMAELFPPMPPPDQAGAQSWSFRRETSSETSVSITSVTVGTARIVGDTTWNGQPAQVIVSEGEAELTGSGTPPGSPGEIELEVMGPVVVRYVWDGTRAVMLASSSKGELSGDVTVVGMGMSFPISFTGDVEVTLQP